MTIPILRFKPLLVIFLFITQLVSSQELLLYGMVSDSVHPLENANILAFSNSNTVFSITNSRGEYILRLQQNTAYDIQISYLGYQKLTWPYTATKNRNKDFKLIHKVNQLDEVELIYKIPIQIKKDTTTYNTDSFVNGKERKLRDVLKKLPGIEVDREGNVTANGEKVTKVLVEGKKFFTGGSKLAVNNIPADAIDEIQVLENYNAVGFLKGLQDSDDVALNIRLKEDKKKFVFGDIEAGAGIENNYILHPTLFYYSPKTNLNLIGDLNNVGVKSFTIGDYLEFEGGFGKLLSDIPGYFKLFNNDFAQFLRNNDFRENTNRFGAFNLRQSVSQKTDLTTYIIWNNEDTQTQVNNLNTFINNDSPFEESRTQTNNLDNNFIIAKLSIDHNASKTSDLSLNSFVKITNNTANGFLLTNSTLQSSNFTTLNDLKSLSLRQNGVYNKRFSKAQTIGLESTLSYQKSNPFNQWVTNNTFLQGLLPLQDDTTINVLQELETRRLSLDFVGKDYWVVNNFNHIYTTIGINLFAENFTSSEEQLLTDGSTNLFSNVDFGNDLDYDFTDVFGGLEYKFLSGVFTVKSGLFYHNYTWNNTQLGKRIHNNIDVVLPQFSAEAAFSNSEKLRLRYTDNVRFPQIRQLNANFLLRSFNSVARGNPNLSNERFDSYSLNYSKFSLFRGIQLVAGLSYNRKSQSIKNTTALEGIEQFATFTLFNQPENSLNANFLYGKKFGDVKLSIESRASYNEFFQLVNELTSLNISKNIDSSVKLETSFKDWPQLELEYTYEPSSFRTSIATNTFTNVTLAANLEYDWKNFVFKTDYSNINFRNNTQNSSNRFDVGNASLFYQKEDSAWGFEISSTNVFNTQFKQTSSFSDFLISDQSTFILPRIVLLKVSYKL